MVMSSDFLVHTGTPTDPHCPGTVFVSSVHAGSDAVVQSSQMLRANTARAVRTLVPGTG